MLMNLWLEKEERLQAEGQSLVLADDLVILAVDWMM